MVHLYSALITRLKGALQWSIYPQRTGSIYRRKLQLLLSSPCMLVLILPTSEGWKAEWTLAGKKVAKYSSLGRTGNGTRDLRVGRQRSYHCANPSAQPLCSTTSLNGCWVPTIRATDSNGGRQPASRPRNPPGPSARHVTTLHTDKLWK